MCESFCLFFSVRNIVCLQRMVYSSHLFNTLEQWFSIFIAPRPMIGLTTFWTSLDEVQNAVNMLSSGKAPGSDATPAEIYKSSGLVLVADLIDSFQSMWRSGILPLYFEDASILRIYQSQGKSSTVWQPSRDLPPIDCWQNPGQLTSEPPRPWPSPWWWFSFRSIFYRRC